MLILLTLVDIVATVIWSTFFLANLIFMYTARGTALHEHNKRLIIELRPFIREAVVIDAVFTIVMTVVNDQSERLAYRIILSTATVAMGFALHWQTRDLDDDDDRWKRRRKKVGAWLRPTPAPKPIRATK